MRDEDWVYGALKASKEICTEVLPRGVSQTATIGQPAVLTLTGQMKYLYFESAHVNSPPARTVKTHAPAKPSTVFLGESLMSGVRPKVMPHMYANTSLTMTKDAGMRNQISPSKMLFITK